jgi:nicotinate phosphoribosyltransferase
MSLALRTDRYELTMLEGALATGVADRRAVFEVFARRLPPGRRFGIVAGQGRLAALLPRLRYGEDELAALDFLRPATCDWLRDRELSVQVTGYREGERYGPGSPVLTVEGCFGEALLLETLVLSVLNHDSAVASAAARMVLAARGRPLVEMGSRRTHEEAAVAAARAAFVAGFAATSNLEAGRRHGVPTTGTSAHAFTLAHRTERDAFAAQVASLGPGTTLLVDTFDVEQGIRTALDVAGPELGAVRLDSGELADEARRARALLDELGATGTRIICTGDLDEHAIAALAAAPADSYGVGTSVVTGSGAPTAGFVYKLVAIAQEGGPDAPLVSVEKRSAGKGSPGGRKWAYRSDDGRELLRRTPGDEGRPLQQPLPSGDDVDAAREHCAQVLDALPSEARRLDPGTPAWTPFLEET